MTDLISNGESGLSVRTKLNEVITRVNDLGTDDSPTFAGADLDGAVVINESGADVDFRVESDTQTHALFVEGSSGNVGIGTTSPGAELEVNGNIIADGVYLGGTGAANLLDDYETGTWTPAYEPDTGAFGAITYDPTTTGRYTKIGNKVFVQGSIMTDSITLGTASGTVRIGGLPFTSSGASRPFGVMEVGGVSDFSGEMPISGIIPTSDTRILCYYRSAVDGASVTLDASDLGLASNANKIWFSAEYSI